MYTLVHETQIFGPINIFSQYLDAQLVLIEMYENYQKRSCRNRYEILTANGPMTLTVPLIKGKNSQMIIRDVRISYDEAWHLNHSQSIKSAYGKSPYFEFYFDKIAEILNKKHTYLLDLNLDGLDFCLKNLKLDVQLGETSNYLDYSGQKEVLDMRNNNHKTGQINKPYIQVWEEKFEFKPYLSVLDLLFCTGPESRMYL